jgi:hypothetical protein
LIVTPFSLQVHGIQHLLDHALDGAGELQHAIGRQFAVVDMRDNTKIATNLSRRRYQMSIVSWATRGCPA